MQIFCTIFMSLNLFIHLASAAQILYLTCLFLSSACLAESSDPAPVNGIVPFTSIYTLL